MRYGFRVAVLFVVQLVFVVAAVFAQTGNSGSIEGTVLDPSGKTVANATVEITNVVSGLARTTNTAKDGTFRFTNVPFNPYHLSVNATGFAPASQDVEVRSFVAAKVDISLTIGTASTPYSWNRTARTWWKPIRPFIRISVVNCSRTCPWRVRPLRSVRS